MSLIRIEAVTDEQGGIPFERWLRSVKDKKIQQQILARIERIKLGNMGDWKSVGFGVSELRIHAGAGYRVYFGRKGNEFILLLGGGSKASQQRDIRKAVELWRWYEDQE